jgi:uncharacterized membrane protein YcaP (DUF421 family)
LVGGFAVLMANWGITRLTASNRFLERTIEGVPTVLVHHGHVIDAALRREGLSREDLLANLRSQGVFDVCEVRAAILENSGRLSVLHNDKPSGEGST